MTVHKALLLALGMLVLAATLSFLTGNRAQASGSAPVTIVGPLPVPVSGSTTVSGTVAASQNGTWNVGINGTPTVSVTTNQPIETNVSEQVTGLGGRFTVFTVPPGKRLVVEHFSSEALVATGVTVTRYLLGTAPDPNVPGVTNFTHFIPQASSSPCPTCEPNMVTIVASQPIRMYVEAGQGLVAGVAFSGSAGTGGVVFFSVSGYLVDAH